MRTMLGANMEPLASMSPDLRILQVKEGVTHVLVRSCEGLWSKHCDLSLAVQMPHIQSAREVWFRFLTYPTRFGGPVWKLAQVSHKPRFQCVVCRPEEQQRSEPARVSESCAEA